MRLESAVLASPSMLVLLAAGSTGSGQRRRIHWRRDRGHRPAPEPAVRGISRLDFPASYDLFRNLTLTADGTSATLVRFIPNEESAYSLGVRFRF